MPIVSPAMQATIGGLKIVFTVGPLATLLNRRFVFKGGGGGLVLLRSEARQGKARQGKVVCPLFPANNPAPA